MARPTAFKLLVSVSPLPLFSLHSLTSLSIPIFTHFIILLLAFCQIELFPIRKVSWEELYSLGGSGDGASSHVFFFARSLASERVFRDLTASLVISIGCERSIPSSG